jgi:hypothetical protein
MAAAQLKAGSVSISRLMAKWRIIENNNQYRETSISRKPALIMAYIISGG